MRVFHGTSRDAAEAILSNGFRDGEGTYMTDQQWRGVWVSDRPLDGSDVGVDSEVMLSFCISVDLFVEYEWVEDGKAYRESLIPATVLNAANADLRISVLTGEDDDEGC